MTASVPVEQALAQAREIEAWKETAAMHHRNEEYYRGLVVRIGEMFGEAAYIADDGGRAEDVLCAKVPELVKAIMNKEESLCIFHDRADGALADAATVPTGNLERGIRALTAERDGLQAEVERVHHNERAFKEQYHKTISYQRERLAHFERSVIDIKVGLRKRIEEERAGTASAEADVKALAEALAHALEHAVVCDVPSEWEHEAHVALARLDADKRSKC